MTLIGKSTTRPDGLAKARGRALFADDERCEGMWFGATVRSPYPRAEIRSIDFDPASAPPGSLCLTADDLPGPNVVAMIVDDWPILAAGEVNHVGEPVALVAAGSRLEALAARDAVQVDWVPKTPVLDIASAVEREPLAELELVAGDPDAVFDAAERTVEGVYSCGHQEHVYIECHAVTAWFDEEARLVVSGSMQCPYYVQRALREAFGLDDSQVRVKASAVGGGFGGKEDYPSMIAVHAALLARASSRPVRLAYDRHEDIIGTTKRHPSVVRHRAAVSPDGRLEAMDIDLVLDGGAYTTLSPVVLSRAVLHATGPYRCANVRIRGKVVRTNTATNGAFRGFGAPQAQFAVERHMDRIAQALGLDPFEIRHRNALRPGDRLPTGQVIDESTAAIECLEEVERRTDFRRHWREAEKSRRPSESDRPHRGIGLSLYFHGAGFTGNGERKMRSPVTARVDEAGRIVVLTSMVDMGQGCATIYSQMAREASGLLDKDIHFAAPDTHLVPDSGPTVASRTTMVVGEAMMRAVCAARDRVLEWWRARGGLDEAPTVRDGEVVGPTGTKPFREVARLCVADQGAIEVTVRHEPPQWQVFDEETYKGSAYPAYSWGADVAEVEVEPDTLEVRPLRVTAVCEVGRVINEGLCRGQVEGGTLQAVGWALLEEMKMEEGRYLNDRLATYIIPTFRDSPRIEVGLLEKPSRSGPFGAKGVGELPMDGAAPAVAAAVENALGARVNDIPATPERLLAVMSPTGKKR
jgi:CO/xanthine dehydrogenase Mo-binding subunit